MKPGDKVCSHYLGDKVMEVVESPAGLLLKGTNGTDVFYTPIFERDIKIDKVYAHAYNN
jgi:hypothetical protein